jgi:hypothetical protein
MKEKKTYLIQAVWQLLDWLEPVPQVFVPYWPFWDLAGRALGR